MEANRSKRIMLTRRPRRFVALTMAFLLLATLLANTAFAQAGPAQDSLIPDEAAVESPAENPATGADRQDPPVAAQESAAVLDYAPPSDGSISVEPSGESKIISVHARTSAANIIEAFAALNPGDALVFDRVAGQGNPNGKMIEAKVLPSGKLTVEVWPIAGAPGDHLEDIRACLYSLRPGDEISFHQGDYVRIPKQYAGTSSINPTNSGIPAQPITIRGFGGGEARPVFLNVGTEQNMWEITGSYLDISYMEFQGAYDDTKNGAGIRIDGIAKQGGGGNFITDVRISDCVFRHIKGTSISANSSGLEFNNLVIENNRFLEMFTTVIYLGQQDGLAPSSGTVVRDNFFDCTDVTTRPDLSATVGYCMELKRAMVNSLVERNLIISPYGPGVMVYGDFEGSLVDASKANVVRNNLIVGGRGDGVNVSGGAALVEKNVLIGNRTDINLQNYYPTQDVYRYITISNNTTGLHTGASSLSSSAVSDPVKNLVVENNAYIDPAAASGALKGSLASIKEMTDKPAGFAAFFNALSAGSGRYTDAELVALFAGKLGVSTANTEDYGQDLITTKDNGSGFYRFHKDNVINPDGNGVASLTFKVTPFSGTAPNQGLRLYLMLYGFSTAEVAGTANAATVPMQLEFRRAGTGVPSDIQVLYGAGGTSLGPNPWSYDTTYEITINLNTLTQQYQVIISDGAQSYAGTWRALRSGGTYAPLTDIGAFGWQQWNGTGTSYALIGDVPHIDPPAPPDYGDDSFTLNSAIDGGLKIISLENPVVADASGKMTYRFKVSPQTESSDNYKFNLFLFDENTAVTPAMIEGENHMPIGINLSRRNGRTIWMLSGRGNESNVIGATWELGKVYDVEIAVDAAANSYSVAVYNQAGNKIGEVKDKPYYLSADAADYDLPFNTIGTVGMRQQNGSSIVGDAVPAGSLSEKRYGKDPLLLDHDKVDSSEDRSYLRFSQSQIDAMLNANGTYTWKTTVTPVKADASGQFTIEFSLFGADSPVTLGSFTNAESAGQLPMFMRLRYPSKDFFWYRNNGGATSFGSWEFGQAYDVEFILKPSNKTYMINVYKKGETTPVTGTSFQSFFTDMTVSEIGKVGIFQRQGEAIIGSYLPEHWEDATVNPIPPDVEPTPDPSRAIRMYGLPYVSTITYPFTKPRTGGNFDISFDLTPEAADVNAYVVFAPIDQKISGDEARMCALQLKTDGFFYVRDYDDAKAGVDDFAGMYRKTAAYEANRIYRVTFSFDLAAKTYSVKINDGAQDIVSQTKLKMSLDPWRQGEYNKSGVSITNIGQLGVVATGSWEKSILLTRFVGAVIENAHDNIIPAADANNPAASGSGNIYYVGPGRKYTKIQDVLSLLQPGDTVRVAGGATYPGPVRFGASNVSLIGDAVNGKKPKIAAASCEDHVRVHGSNVVFEGFSVEGNLVKLYQFKGLVGANPTAAELFRVAYQTRDASGNSTVLIGDTGIMYRGVRSEGRNLTIRNCEIYGHFQGITGGENYQSGDRLIIENNDIYYNGTDDYSHNIYIASNAGTAVIRGNIIRDALADNGLKSRFARNEVYNNYFYNNLRAMELIGNSGATLRNPRRDGDIVGNVFYADRAERNDITFIRVGADGTGVDSSGRFRIVNNTFIDNIDSTTHQNMLTAFREVESVEMFNNAFYSLRGTQLFSDSANWASGKRLIQGSNNWVSDTIKARPVDGIPSEWENTVIGDDPMFASIAGLDFTLAEGSPLNAAGIAFAETVAVWEPWTNNAKSSIDTAFPNPLTAFASAVTPRNLSIGVNRKDADRPAIGAFEGNTSIMPPTELPMNIHDNGESFRLYPVDWEIATVDAVDQDGKPVALVENRQNVKPEGMILFGYNKYVAGQGFLPEMTALDVYKNDGWRKLTLKVGDGKGGYFHTTLTNDRATKLTMNVYDNGESFRLYPVGWEITSVTAADQDGKAVALVENRQNVKPEGMILFGYNKYVSGQGYLPVMTTLDVYKNDGWRELSLTLKDANGGVFTTTLLNDKAPKIVITKVTNGNGQSNIDFAIRSANGKGYAVWICETKDGQYKAADANFNSSGAHVKKLENGKVYYAYVEYSSGGVYEKSAIVSLKPSK